MSKMTDKEIIKALECCIKLNAEPRNWEICKKDCPYKFNCCDREKEISVEKDILDLINRQQAENNRQKAEIEKLQLSRKQKLKEIEKLTINMNAFGLGMKREKERADTIRAEAIKEFADRLKENNEFKYSTGVVFSRNIDNLVAEMVGEQE